MTSRLPASLAKPDANLPDPVNGLAAKLRGSDLLPLLALLAMALGIRLIRLDFRSLWLDEAYSLVLSSANLPGIISGAIMDIHPPLFHILLAGWIRMFGTSEFAVRSLSAVFGALFVVAVFYLTRNWINRRAAWLAAILVCFSPYFLEISRTGRMAAQLALFSLGSVYFYLRCLEKGSLASRVGYVLCSLAALYTHYFAILVLLAQHLFIFMGIGKLKLSRDIRKNWLILQLVLAAGFSPWLVYFWNHILVGGPSWRGIGAAWYEPLHSLYAFMAGTACWTWWHKAWLAGFVLSGLALTLQCCLPRVRECYHLMRPKIWGLLLTLILVPLGCVWIYSLLKINVFDNRYLSIPAAGLYILIAGLISYLPPVRQKIALALILTGFVVPVANQYFVYGYYDNWRLAGTAMLRRAQPGDVAAIYPAWNQTPLEYYLRGRIPIQGIPGHYNPITGITEDYFQIDSVSINQLESVFTRCNRIWLVLVNEGQEQEIIRDWFAQDFSTLSKWQEGGLQISELRRKNSP